MARKQKAPIKTPAIRARMEDIAWMGKTGATTEEAAARLGLSLATLRKNIDRHRAWPLWDRMESNERERWGMTLAELRHLANAGNKMTTAA